MLLETIYQLNKKNPEKSDILVSGYGRMALDLAKRTVIKRLEESVDMIKKKDNPMAWRNAYQLIYRDGGIEATLEAIIEANEELEDIKNN